MQVMFQETNKNTNTHYFLLLINSIRIIRKNKKLNSHNNTAAIQK